MRTDRERDEAHQRLQQLARQTPGADTTASVLIEIGLALLDLTDTLDGRLERVANVVEGA
jgi:hypothetical protein